MTFHCTDRVVALLKKKTLHKEEMTMSYLSTTRAKEDPHKGPFTAAAHIQALGNTHVLCPLRTEQHYLCVLLSENTLNV